jgi:uncharacterized protein (TIGR03067 family)
MSVRPVAEPRRDVIVVALQLLLMSLLLLAVGAAGWCLYVFSQIDPVARAVQEAEDNAVRREYVARQPEVARQQRDMEQLQGEWELISAEQDGRTIPPAALRRAYLRVTGDEHVATVGGQAFNGSYVLEPLRSPKGIDTLDRSGPLSGGPASGIYELTGDVFRVCFAAPGDARPYEFTTRSGTGRMLFVWKRRQE